jgi:putative tryptophan/tyrosine transport system substrate-binding protein
VNRREFIAGLGAAAWPAVAWTQQPTTPVIGYIGNGTAESGASSLAAIRKGLAEMGYTEGRNVVLELRWTENDFSRLPELTADLVRRRVSVIFVNSPPSVRVAKEATSTIPIIFMVGEDPIKEGLVTSLNRPGGNVTGYSDFANQLAGKRLGLLHDTVPKAESFALLVDQNNPNAEPDTKEMNAAAAALSLDMHVVTASGERDFEPAFAEIGRLRVGAVIVNTAPYLMGLGEQFAALAVRHAIPTMFDRREFPAAGGLMSYGTDRLDSVRRAAVYVGRVLKGEKAAEMPVQQATRFEFVINLKTAKTLGLDIPPGVLAIVDDVIQ